MKFKKVVIIGTGLIGGSIGKALLEKGLAEEVVGVCRRGSTLKRAIREKVFTKGYLNSYSKAIPGADIVIIATPVNTIKKILSDLSVTIKDKNVVVSDVGSTKEEIVKYADRFKRKFTFVGAHPLAGSEKSGVEYAEAGLFLGSLCLLTPTKVTPKKALDKVKRMWSSLGANVDIMSPQRHDSILAFTSHLPHAVAYALAGSQEKSFYRYMATGFRDTTRIASSDPGLWSDIFITNRRSFLASLKKFKKVLSAIEADIAKGRKVTLGRKLAACRDMREGLFEKN